MTTQKNLGREVADELQVDAVFEITRAQQPEHSRRKMFAYEAAHNIITDPQEVFRINCFNVILDTVLSSLEA